MLPITGKIAPPWRRHVMSTGIVPKQRVKTTAARPPAASLTVWHAALLSHLVAATCPVLQSQRHKHHWRVDAVSCFIHFNWQRIATHDTCQKRMPASRCICCCALRVVATMRIGTPAHSTSVVSSEHGHKRAYTACQAVFVKGVLKGSWHPWGQGSRSGRLGVGGGIVTRHHIGRHGAVRFPPSAEDLAAAASMHGGGPSMGSLPSPGTGLP